MSSTLTRSTENAIVLFLLSIVSSLIVDYQANGYPPSPEVVYSSLLFALFAFLTTMATQSRKKRKEKKEAIERGKELEKIIESSNENNSPTDSEVLELSKKVEDSGKNSDKGDDWLIGCVI